MQWRVGGGGGGTGDDEAEDATGRAKLCGVMVSAVSSDRAKRGAERTELRGI